MVPARPLVTVVIRSLNEGPELQKLFEILKRQTVPLDQQQWLLVDNQSTISPAPLAERFGTDIILLPRKEFSYPRSLNLGWQHARGKFVAFLCAHSFPMDNHWLENGLKAIQSSDDIAGVYGPNLAYKDSPLLEKIFYFPGALLYRLRWLIPDFAPKLGMGIMGMTNAMVRRSFLEEDPFDESYGNGGEDYHWTKIQLEKHRRVLHVSSFAVRHAHYLSSWRELQLQKEHWEKLVKGWRTEFSLEAIEEFRPGAEKFRS